jgi:hypothetical protein
VARQVLKPRTRYVPDPGPFEGVPAHLLLPLTRWLASAVRLGSPIEDNDALYTIMTRLRIPPIPGNDGGNPLWRTIVKWIDEDQIRLIAVIEVVMDIRMIDYQQLRMLEQILSDGGSMYTATENGIEERVDPVAKQAFTTAVQPKDHASTELSEAWSKAYGQQQNASDAWDHAIKAVEALLVPLVVPNLRSGRIGHVVGQLDQPGSRWVLLLQFNQLSPPKNPPFTSIEVLVGMLRLIWPNPIAMPTRSIGVRRQSKKHAPLFTLQ